MAVSNLICDKCDHQFVCKKKSVLDRFDNSSKKFIRMNITINECLDFKNSDGEEDS